MKRPSDEQREASFRPGSNGSWGRGFGISDEDAELRLHARLMLWDREVGDELFRLAQDNASRGEHVSADGKALIIEDEYVIGEELRALALRAGIAKVELVPRIDQALSLVKTNVFDIIFIHYCPRDRETDLHAISQLREASGAQAGFITAYPQLILRLTNFLPDFLIQKPIRPEAVIALIGHWLADKEMY